jgi:glycosyltransferase involved in cell wall biosynthesis
VKVLIAHNQYQQPGGEDQVFAAEAALLEARDHQVMRYRVHNEQVADMNHLNLAKTTLWNSSSYRDIRSFIRRERPQVAHFHNTLPLISPAAYHAAAAEGVPVVQTLHNYRLICPGGLLFRSGRVCEDCLGKVLPWPAGAHACYRQSRAATGAVAAMLVVHRALRTWTEKVGVYIALTDFARGKFIDGGLPAEAIVVKPNFIHPDPGPGKGRGEYMLFVGRLSQEKGIDTLLEAWEKFGGKVPLRIVGDGPLAPKVAEAAERLGKVEWLGRQPKERVLALMKDARALLFPSVCYENAPMVIAEAYAVGLPVIASYLGGMSSLICHGRTGLHFRPGDPKDLSDKVEWSLEHPAEFERMRGGARAEFEAKYTAEENYRMLMEIYESVANGVGAQPRV